MNDLEKYKAEPPQPKPQLPWPSASDLRQAIVDGWDHLPLFLARMEMKAHGQPVSYEFASKHEQRRKAEALTDIIESAIGAEKNALQEAVVRVGYDIPKPGSHALSERPDIAEYLRQEKEWLEKAAKKDDQFALFSAAYCHEVRGYCRMRGHVLPEPELSPAARARLEECARLAAAVHIKPSSHCQNR